MSTANGLTLQACIKEALRLFPPATMLGRQLAEDVVIEGRTLPKGNGVMVSIYSYYVPSSNTV